jgi:hypothetical protein
MPNETLRVPAFCPVCDLLMMGKSTYSFYNYGCCIDCQIFYIEGREKRWQDGWRPSKEEVQRRREFMTSTGMA